MLANRSRFAPNLSLLAAAMVSSCVPPPPSAPVPVAAPVPPPATPRPVLPPAPPAPADWRDAPQSAGKWLWGMDGERSVARFGEAGMAPVATLTCEPGTFTVVLRVAGQPGAAPAAPGETTVIVTTTGTRQMFTAAADPSGGGAAALAPRDPMLDAIAFSRGRFMVEMPGVSTLYLPSWPEVSRVIEDCRGGVVHRPEAGPKP